ncbi:MAG: hypothetical protein ABL921_15675 [Pirellula sp.]
MKLIHAFCWVVVLVGWIVVSRNNHPTLLLNVLATSVLVCGSAVLYYLSQLWIIPEFKTGSKIVLNSVKLLLLIAAIDVVMVLVIELLYDQLHGRDPRRFGWVNNLVIDAAFIVLHLILGSVAATIANQRLRIRVSSDSEPRSNLP